MNIVKIEIMHLKIPFKVRFKHSLKSRKSSDNIVIKLFSQHNFGLGESLPRKYVTGESIESCFEVLNNKILPYFKSKKFEDYKQVIDEILKFRKNLKKNELSAFAAFEVALLNLCAKEFNIKIKDVFNYLDIYYLDKKSIEYSAIIAEHPIPILIVKALYIKRQKFKHIKIKVDLKSKLKLRILRKIFNNEDLRVDANCAFNIDNYEDFLKLLDELDIRLFEQPFAVNDPNRFEMYKLAQKYDIKIILDESFCEFEDIKKIGKEGDIANIRVSKNGGIVNSLLMYKELKEKKHKIIFACLVGETILTKINIMLAKHFGAIEIEGDYDKYLFERPIIKNPTFDNSGKLEDKKIDLDFCDDIKNYEMFLIKKEVIIW